MKVIREGFNAFRSYLEVLLQMYLGDFPYGTQNEIFEFRSALSCQDQSFLRGFGWKMCLKSSFGEKRAGFRISLYYIIK